MDQGVYSLAASLSYFWLDSQGLYYPSIVKADELWETRAKMKEENPITGAFKEKNTQPMPKQEEQLIIFLEGFLVKSL